MLKAVAGALLAYYTQGPGARRPPHLRSRGEVAEFNGLYAAASIWADQNAGT